MRPYSWQLALLALTGLLLTNPAWSQEERRFSVQLTVTHISEQPGQIDPRGRRLDGELRKKFRYNSLKVLKQRRLALAMDEVGSIDLPTGRAFRVRPLNLGDRGLLMAVGWDGAVQMDMRAPSRHLLVIGGPPYESGQLVVSIEPEY